MPYIWLAIGKSDSPAFARLLATFDNGKTSHLHVLHEFIDYLFMSKWKVVYPKYALYYLQISTWKWSPWHNAISLHAHHHAYDIYTPIRNVLDKWAKGLNHLPKLHLPCYILHPQWRQRSRQLRSRAHRTLPFPSSITHLLLDWLCERV